MFEINSKYKNNGTAFNDKQTPCLKSIPLFQPHKLGHNLRQASTFGSTRPPKSIHVALRCGTCCWSLRRRHQNVAEKWEKTVGKCPHSFWWHPQHCQSMPPLFRKKKMVFVGSLTPVLYHSQEFNNAYRISSCHNYSRIMAKLQLNKKSKITYICIYT